MPPGTILFFRSYFRVWLAFVVTICLIRVFEYFTVASKYFISHAYRFELTGLLYDLWSCFIYSAILFLPWLFLYWLSHRVARFIFHFLNVLLIILYLALL